MFDESLSRKKLVFLASSASSAMLGTLQAPYLAKTQLKVSSQPTGGLKLLTSKSNELCLAGFAFSVGAMAH